MNSDNDKAITKRIVHVTTIVKTINNTNEYMYTYTHTLIQCAFYHKLYYTCSIIELNYAVKTHMTDIHVQHD